jgi:hypothetical protein
VPCRLISLPEGAQWEDNFRPVAIGGVAGSLRQLLAERMIPAGTTITGLPLGVQPGLPGGRANADTEIAMNEIHQSC